MDNKIPLLPVIPDGLRIAANTGKLVPFVGAGVSVLGGCPGWADFATETLRYFVKKEKISPAQLDQLSHVSPRVKLAIANALEKEHGISVDFADLLRPKPGDKKDAGDRIYAGLAKLGSTFVTTNYDDWLDTMPSSMDASRNLPSGPELNSPHNSRDVVYRLADFNLKKLSSPNTVLHIHGSVRDRTSMVLTTSDYLKRYKGHRLSGDERRENHFLTFLEMLFRQKCVLFVGYGLEELEILEYVLQKSRYDIQSSSEVTRHYILQGFFSHQVELMRSLELYYRNECGITLIPFSRDVKDWNQLIDVVEYLGKQIPVGSLLNLQERLEMQRLLDE